MSEGDKAASVEMMEQWGVVSIKASELTSLRARVVDLTARVAVLEEALRGFRRAVATWAKDEVAGPDAFADADTKAIKVLRALRSSSPTPGEAWRAMVDALEELVLTFDDQDTSDLLRERLAKASGRAALAAARAVMGG